MNIPKNCVQRGRKHKMTHECECMCSECGISCGEVGHYEVRNNVPVYVVVSPKLDKQETWKKAHSFIGNKVKLESLCASFRKKSN